MNKPTFQNFSFEGTLRFAKIFPENREMRDPKGLLFKRDKSVSDKDAGKYTVDFIPDDVKAVKKALKAAGSKKWLKEKTDREGNDFEYFTFDRFHLNPRAPKAGGPPVVTVNGKPWTYEDGLIGNGSHATVKVNVYGPLTSTKEEDGEEVTYTYSITTLEEVHVDNLVEYVSRDTLPDSYTETAFERMPKGTEGSQAAETKEEETPKKPSKTKKTSDVPDDEIPF